MPAMAITKNMPAVPDTPKRNNTADDKMMVSMVMPETGLRAVVATALAATEVKKNEKSRTSRSPTPTTVHETGKLPRNAATAMALMMTPMRIEIMDTSRSVRSCCATSP